MKKLAEIKKMIKSGELKEKLLTGEDLHKKYAKWILAFYTIIVLWIIVFKCNVNGSLHIQENLEKTLWERFTYRLIPFTDLAYLIRSGTFDLEGLAFLFNIISFMPLGMFLMLFMNKKKSVIKLFFFSLGVEIFQLFKFNVVIGSLTFLGVALPYLFSVCGTLGGINTFFLLFVKLLIFK